MWLFIPCRSIIHGLYQFHCSFSRKVPVICGRLLKEAWLLLTCRLFIECHPIMAFARKVFGNRSSVTVWLLYLDNCSSIAVVRLLQFSCIQLYSSLITVHCSWFHLQSNRARSGDRLSDDRASMLGNCIRTVSCLFLNASLYKRAFYKQPNKIIPNNNKSPQHVAQRSEPHGRNL